MTKRKRKLRMVSARVFAQASWNRAPDNITPHVTYNVMKSNEVDETVSPTSETCRHAEWLFDKEIKNAAVFKPMKEHDKRIFWQKLLHWSKRAIYEQGCSRYSRDNNKQGSHAHLQVIDAAVERGLLLEQRSPPGSPKQSRLIPTDKLRQITECDPWTFDPPTDCKYVFLRDRESKDELPFDANDPVASKYQKRLAKINEVNGAFDIFYSPYCEWDEEFQSRRQLRPVHYARFTDDFDQHGRIYTGKYGQQGLRKNERATIEFQLEPHKLEPSVELDYGSLHARMAYHLAGIDYRDDPYKLWGSETTEPMRLLAKTIINAAFNAKDGKAAVSDCNQKLRRKTKPKKGKPQWKTGKERETCDRLNRAIKETGLTFKGIYELACEHHSRIADQFSSDAGMRFMRIDSEIALNIMYHFAKLGIPCLGVHDSFIVPRIAKTELHRVMRKFYKRKVNGFLPIIK